MAYAKKPDLDRDPDPDVLLGIKMRVARIEDTRDTRARLHPLENIITLALCGFIAGADNWVAVETYAERKRWFFERYLDLSNGVPSHDTFGRVFSILQPGELNSALTEMASEMADKIDGDVVALDGKTLRGSRDEANGVKAFHSLAAYSSGGGLVLAQIKTEDHSNEITAIPKLLDAIDVSGCVVTIDAMGCQKEIAAKIIDKGADYALSLKRNQPRLYADVLDMFEAARETEFEDVPADFAETVEKGHGRIETRRCHVVSAPEWIDHLNDLGEWERLRSVAMIESIRESGGRESGERRCYISSLDEGARRMLSVVRRHWGIENSVHWVLDVAFREDDCRMRKGSSAENAAILRRVALNKLKRETTAKVGIAIKRQMAGWDDQYMIKVLKS